MDICPKIVKKRMLYFLVVFSASLCPILGTAGYESNGSHQRALKLDGHNNNPLNIAAWQGNVAEVERLLKTPGISQEDKDNINASGHTPLSDAID